MAMVPLLDNPLLTCWGAAVPVTVEDKDDVCDVELGAVVSDEVGMNVLNDV
jgi:hypothetical protein